MKRRLRKSCPFLGEEKVLYCRAFPLKKPLPFEKIYGPENLCLKGNFARCPIYRERGAEKKAPSKICPFVEVETVSYCKLFPAKKVPLSGVFELENPCTTEKHQLCPLFVALKQGDLLRERVGGTEGFTLDPSVTYLPEHYWIREVEGGHVLGLDDFAQALLGPIGGLVLPKEGDLLKKGEILLTVQGAMGKVELLSPLELEVMEINRSLKEDPLLLNRDPYGKGWILKARLMQLPHEAYKGESAHSWMRRELERIYLLVADGEIRTMLDGGDVTFGWAFEMDEKKREQAMRTFLYVKAERR